MPGFGPEHAYRKQLSQAKRDYASLSGSDICKVRRCNFPPGGRKSGSTCKRVVRKFKNRHGVAAFGSCGSKPILVHCFRDVCEGHLHFDIFGESPVTFEAQKEVDCFIHARRGRKMREDRLVLIQSVEDPRGRAVRGVQPGRRRAMSRSLAMYFRNAHGSPSALPDAVPTTVL